MVVKPKLLLIYHNQSELLRVCGLLEAEGYSVRGATSTGEAAILLAKEDYRAVLCAVSGPGAEAFYLGIRESYPRYRNRFVALVADERCEETWTFVEQCEIPYVTMPFDAASLRRVLGERTERPPAPSVDAARSERREHHRVTIAADVRIRAGHAKSEEAEFASTINFSKQALLFSSDRPYRAGDRVLLVFPYSERLNEPERAGYVVRVEERGGTRLVAVVLEKSVPAQRPAVGAASA